MNNENKLPGEHQFNISSYNCEKCDADDCLLKSFFMNELREEKLVSTRLYEEEFEITNQINETKIPLLVP